VALMPPSEFALALVPFLLAAAAAPGATTELPCTLPSRYTEALAAQRSRVDQVGLAGA
jgi:hypothetical protein